jgi:hypothetical protein
VPATKGLAKRSEKGLLTPDNCVVTLIDHQPQMLFGTSNFDRQSIINNTVALANSVMLELQRDWAQKDTYDAVMDIVKHHYGAYGIGVEYAYTMVHKAPATVFPEYVIPSPTNHR